MHSSSRWILFAIGWAVALVAGAVVHRLLRPEAHSALLAVLSASEAVHIIAHSLLYGTLAVASARALRRWGAATAITLLVGLAQEGAQVAWANRGFGGPELFDLCVDLAAASIAIACFGPTRAKHTALGSSP